MKSLRVLAIGLVMSMSLAMAAAEDTPEVRMVEARLAFVYEGPGAFYAKHDVVKMGAVVQVGAADPTGRWLRVVSYPVSEDLLKQQAARKTEAAAAAVDLWIADRILSRDERKLPPEKIQLAQEAFRLDDLTASSALRGFGPFTQDQLNAKLISPGDLAYILVRPFTAEQYLKFRAETVEGRVFPQFNVSWLPMEQFDIETRQDMGDVLAIKILQRYNLKPIMDAPLNRYVNMVAAFIVDRSPAFNMSVRVLIVEGKEVTSFSVPGGIIIITDKLLMSCKDEAELAGVLAHEIVHLARCHGLRERAAVQAKIGIDLASLERDLNEEWAKRHKGQKPPWDRPSLQELDVMASEFLARTLLRGYRIHEENEADAYGVVFLYFAGYDVNAMSEFISRVLAQKTSPWPIGMEMHPQIADRIGFIRGIVRDYVEPMKEGNPEVKADARYAERFQKAVEVLKAKPAAPAEPAAEKTAPAEKETPKEKAEPAAK